MVVSTLILGLVAAFVVAALPRLWAGAKTYLVKGSSIDAPALRKDISIKVSVEWRRGE